MSKPKVYFMEYVHSFGASHMVLLNPGNGSEVIISCGALGSPQLLLLNKIDPRGYRFYWC
jgi:hypothetical protein